MNHYMGDLVAGPLWPKLKGKRITERDAEAWLKGPFVKLSDMVRASLAREAKTERQLVRGICNAEMPLLFEVLFLVEGVSIQVRDADLVQALMRTKFDCDVQDVHIPFPLMEFVFAPGIDIGKGFQLGGCLFGDPRYMVERIKQITHEFFQIDLFKHDGGVIVNAAEQMNVCMTCLTKPVKMGQSPSVPLPTLNLRLKEDMKVDLEISEQQYGEGMLTSDEYVVEKTTQVCLGLLLYLQQASLEDVLKPAPVRKVPRTGPAGVLRSIKRLPHYDLIDMMPKPKVQSVSHGGTHASPEPHWRMGTLRTLRAARYYKNVEYPPRKWRTTWVRPCKVGRGQPVSHGRKIK